MSDTEAPDSVSEGDSEEEEYDEEGEEEEEDEEEEGEDVTVDDSHSSPDSATSAPVEPSTPSTPEPVDSATLALRQAFSFSSGLSEREVLHKLTSGEISVAQSIERSSLEIWAQDILIYSCARNYVNAVKSILRDPDSDPTRFDSRGLVLAVAKGYMNVVKVLLADPRLAVPSNEVLVTACRCQRLPIVRLLLKNRQVDPGACGNRALLGGATFGHLDVVKLLLKSRGVDPTDGDFAALRTAAAKGYEDVVRAILKDRRVLGQWCSVIRI